MNVLISLAFLFSIAALVYAVRAHKHVKGVMQVVEDKNTVTVVICADGKSTIIRQEIK